MTTDLYVPKISELHIADRPRERLIHQGAESLSNQELIAILLRTGTRSESVLQLSNRVLAFFDRIQDMQHATLEEMTSVKGIGEAKAVQLLAAVELGKRLTRKQWTLQITHSRTMRELFPGEPSCPTIFCSRYN